jgi:hypothetical protein
MKYTYSELLMCDLGSIEIVRDDKLKLHLLGCPDMSGAIKMAKSVLPDVRRILCYDDGERDCEYIYEHMDIGKWHVTIWSSDYSY